MNYLRIVIILAMILLASVLLWYGWRGYQSTVVIIDWSTASEFDTVGFNLYRSQYLEGPFEKVNPALIPSALDPVSGGDYSYQDSQVIAGERYYYWLEDVNAQGGTNRHGPIEVQAEKETTALLQVFLAIILIMITGIGLVRELPWVRSHHSLLPDGNDDES